jgi:hypothetical protein
VEGCCHRDSETEDRRSEKHQEGSRDRPAEADDREASVWMAAQALALAIIVADVTLVSTRSVLTERQLVS